MASAIITDRAMQARPAPKDIWLIEAGARGEGRLVGRITPAGARNFYYRYTGSSGDRVRLPIGSYDARGNGLSAFTVQQARDRARELSVLYRGGIVDLREHLARQVEDRRQADSDSRQAAKEKLVVEQLERERRLTVRQLFERWQSVDLQPRIGADGKRAGRKDGGEYTRQQFERHIFPHFANTAATDLRKGDLMRVLDEVKAAGKFRTCNVLLSDLKQMFAFALMREVVDRNPLAVVMRSHAGGKEASRERTLSYDEITTLAKKVRTANLNVRTKAGLFVLLATGVRVGELMGAVWAKAADLRVLAASPEAADVKVGSIDLTARTWYLPDTKNQRDHTIHLSDFAVRQFEILASLRETKVDKDGTVSSVPWVFPNTSGDGPVCVKSFGKQISDRQRPPEKRMSGRSRRTESLVLAGGRWTGHDLRRTAATQMAGLGVSGDVIDECLNHVIESRVRRTYIVDRRPLEQARAFDLLGARLEQSINANGLSAEADPDRESVTTRTD
jgi:integrase